MGSWRCTGWGQTGEVVLGRRRNLWSALCLSPWLLFSKDTELLGFAVYKLQKTASTGSRAEPTTGGIAGAAEETENQAHPLHPSLSQAAPPCPFWGQTVMMLGGGWQQPYPLFPCVGWTPGSARLASSELDSGIFFFLSLCLFFATAHCLQDLSSPTRD